MNSSYKVVIADCPLSVNDLISIGSDSPDVDYLQLNDVSSPFKIRGTASMSWEGGSRNAFQIKVGNSPTPTSVPEPGTIGAIFVTGMTGLGLSKKNKKDEKN